MNTERVDKPGRKRWVPREGAGCAMLRGLGCLSEATGALMAIAGLVGLTASVIRLGPGLVSALQPPVSQFAGFVAILLGVWLVLPLAGMVLGFGAVGLGCVLRRIGSRPEPV